MNGKSLNLAGQQASMEELEARFMLSTVPYNFEFSLDIGSDTELSDPNVNGNEYADPGDVYLGTDVISVAGGVDGFKDDATLWPAGDPDPNPPDSTLATAVPVGDGSGALYYGYFFDMDGHDQVDFDLREHVEPDVAVTNPISYFPTGAVFDAQYLAISYDDDQAPGWSTGDVPVTASSPAGIVYGSTAGQDELFAVTLDSSYMVTSVVPLADEIMVNPYLAPNPDTADQKDDDDVDSLDIVAKDVQANYWLFTADHEGTRGLDPGDIYQVNPGGSPIMVIDAQTHLGLQDGTDVDAFELVWINADQGTTFLALLFSVDENDSVTQFVDESGTLNPNMIYASFLNGLGPYPIESADNPFTDDIDAITNWMEPIDFEEPDPDFDWGDAPDNAAAALYPTLASSNGANHVVGSLFLGATVDAEPNGQPHPNALGDDLNGAPDEDGVVFTSPLMQGGSTTVTVTASAPGLLQGWVDFNGINAWTDAGEQIFIDQPLVAGPNFLNFNVPAAAITGQTFARFRISTVTGLSEFGNASNGEVEDYEVYIEPENQSLDFGDAPDAAGAAMYPTLLIHNGARHAVGSGLNLTGGVDVEPNGQPDPNALGDDNDGNDDEGGIVFYTPFVAGQSAQLRAYVSTTGGILQGWIDFNGDNDWADPGEQIITDATATYPSAVYSFNIPAGAVIGQTFARFRLSTQAGLSYDGYAPDGEVEDYELFIEEPEPDKDWGDAPDQPYPTLSTSNGANHVIDGITYLGNLVDPEPNGQPHPIALGDDLNNQPDEDGVTLTSLIVPGYLASVDVFASTGGFLDAWADFNGDGSWATSPAENIFPSIWLNPGLNQLTFMVPTGTTGTMPGSLLFTRFRFSTAGGLRPDGGAQDGEVEDHVFNVEEVEGLDFGDAPDGPYPTLIASSGAAHIFPMGPAVYYLGNLIDLEADGQPSPPGLGDDNNGLADEDGVTFTSAIVQGHMATVDVWASAPGMLDAWIDFEGNGNWTDAWDQLFGGSIALNLGLNTLSFNVPVFPTGPTTIVTYARFRFSSGGGLAPTGVARDGEVEDYEVKITLPGAIQGHKFWDVNANANWDAGEPTMAGWRVYADMFNLGTWDPGEPFDITDAAGNYMITNLVPGTYTIAEEAQTYWTQTYPAGGTHTIGVVTGTITTGKDFGNWMTGDYDFDQDVDDADLDLMMTQIRSGAYAPLYDLDGDSNVDRDDLDIHVHNLVFVGGSSTNRGSNYGDASLSGYVDDDDLSLLLATWNSGTTWSQGNFIDNTPPIDPTTNDNDLSLLLANWNWGTPPPTGSSQLETLQESAEVSPAVAAPGLLQKAQRAKVRPVKSVGRLAKAVGKSAKADDDDSLVDLLSAIQLNIPA